MVTCNAIWEPDVGVTGGSQPAEALMATDTRKPDDKAAGDLRTVAASPSEAPGQPPEFPPTGLTVTDTWADTADPSGTVASSRTVPEPDSLGG